MSSTRSKLATYVGVLLFLSGIAVFAAGVALRGEFGQALYSALGLPVWVFQFWFVSAPLLGVSGAVLGMRYGHFERYHRDYNPDTGTIDSDHPFAALQSAVTKDDPANDRAIPDQFVLTRTRLAVIALLPAAAMVTYTVTAAPRIDGTFRTLVIGLVALGTLGGFVITDYVLRTSDQFEYQSE